MVKETKQKNTGFEINSDLKYKWKYITIISSIPLSHDYNSVIVANLSKVKMS